MGITRPKKQIPDDRVYLGKLTKPHALQGEMKFQSFGCDPWMLEDIGIVFSEHPEMVLEVEYVRGSHRAPIIKFKAIDDRNASDQLAGVSLWVKEEALPELNENFVYASRVLNCRVLTVSGEEIGIVEDIMETGEFDVMVVRNRDQEWLIPANHEVIREIRLQKKEIVIEPPEGLFESQQRETGPQE